VVLIVEDEADVLRVTARALREAGYLVLEALSGPEALEILDRHGGRLDLMLTDVAMPEMNGREITEAVRRRYPSLPVLFMSGEASGGAAGHAPSVAGTMFLQKPFSPDAVAAQVRVLLDQQRA
jgi:two-component system cell cycle sensor histidine kinase/response regulator CckA